MDPVVCLSSQKASHTLSMNAACTDARRTQRKSKRVVEESDDPDEEVAYQEEDEEAMSGEEEAEVSEEEEDGDEVQPMFPDSRGFPGVACDKPQSSGHSLTF